MWARAGYGRKVRAASEWLVIVACVLLFLGATSVLLRRRARAGRRWMTSDSPAWHSTPQGWAKHEVLIAATLLTAAGALALASG